MRISAQDYDREDFPAQGDQKHLPARKAFRSETRRSTAKFSHDRRERKLKQRFRYTDMEEKLTSIIVRGGRLLLQNRERANEEKEDLRPQMDDFQTPPAA